VVKGWDALTGRMLDLGVGVPSFSASLTIVGETGATFDRNARAASEKLFWENFDAISGSIFQPFPFGIKGWVIQLCDCFCACSRAHVNLKISTVNFGKARA